MCRSQRAGACHGKPGNGLPTTDEKFFEAAIENEITPGKPKNRPFSAAIVTHRLSADFQFRRAILTRCHRQNDKPPTLKTTDQSGASFRRCCGFRGWLHEAGATGRSTAHRRGNARTDAGTRVQQNVRGIFAQNSRTSAVRLHIVSSARGQFVKDGIAGHDSCIGCHFKSVY